MKRQITLMILAMVLIPFSALARNYSASFKGSDAQTTLEIITKATGYDFVYQSGLLDSINGKVTGTYKNVALDELLNQTLYSQLGLNYKVIDKSISLSKAQRKAIKRKVTGTVYDEEGEPLIGASVLVEGTTSGVATDLDGNFSIEVEGESPVLAVSYIGMHPFTTRLNDRNTSKPLKIVLSSNANLMDEVVVTGYQNIKRENATGAYTIISSEELDKRHTTNLVNNLEGNIPGVVKQNSNYKEGEDLLTIRGQGTFEARTAPLVVVDGLPIEGGLNSVNTYDVESITVLKDASAAAIYGARASNGVIVITTKSAKKEKLSIDFNADLSITDKINYNKGGLATAAQTIELERLNWNAMRDDDDQSSFNKLLTDWNRGGFYAQGISQVKRLFVQNHLGHLSDAELNSTLDSWSRNDYRKEWQNAVERTRVNQQYNLSLRSQGKTVNSNIVLNYSHDNMGLQKEYNRSLQFRYRGEMKVAKWLDLDFSVNVLNQRSKSLIRSYGDYNSFAPYQSMYNAVGTLAAMEAGCYLDNPAFNNPDYELKDHSFNLRKDLGQSDQTDRYTNLRGYIHANIHLPVKGWNASAQFQYEDIDRTTQYMYGKNSYYVRDLYNLYTTVDNKTVWVDDPNWDFSDWDGDFDHLYKKPVLQDVTTHHLPDGAILQSSHNSGNYYTFRAQTNYNRTFLNKHEISVLAGMEFREVHTRGSYDMRLGYDPQTLTNQITATDWNFINGWGNASILGPEYTATGLLYGNFNNTDVLHRYYSYYFTANYVYDSRYSLFGSYRVDKTDLFGSDPKFRGRPLWSVGASWNIHNEKFMQNYT